MKLKILTYTIAIVAAFCIGLFIGEIAPVKTSPYTRAEIAPVLVSVYSAFTGNVPPTADCPFVDINDLPEAQHDAVCQLWGLGVVVGTERDSKYSPELPAAPFAKWYMPNLVAAIERDSSP